MKSTTNVAIVLVTVGCLVSVGTAAEDQADQVLLEWNQRLLQTIRETDGIPHGFPGPVSRCIAMVFTSVHDAVNSASPKYKPYDELIACPPGTLVEAAAVSAAYHAMSLAYTFAPLQQPEFDEIYAMQLARIPDSQARTDGIVLGQQVANNIFQLRQGDGSNARPAYEFGVGPGHWIPTWPDHTGPATPHWPLVQPWCMTSGDQFRPELICGQFTEMSKLLASPEYAAQFDEVKELGAINSSTRTAYETETAFFWANCRVGTYKPPGHMLHIAEVLADDHQLALHEQARLFALTAVAMADSAIASWDTKYALDIDLWRPITAIWEADTDGNPLTEAEDLWLSLSFDPTYGAQGAFTPPFPAWASGHATFGASTAAVWKHFFQTDDVTFTITSDDAPGVWRTYTKFTDAALENGRSRVFFGVHFQWDSDAGFEIGTALGDYIGTNFFGLLADLTSDGTVDIEDLLALLNDWGNAGVGDINEDGIVDIFDLLMLLSYWS